MLLGRFAGLHKNRGREGKGERGQEEEKGIWERPPPMTKLCPLAFYYRPILIE